MYFLTAMPVQHQMEHLYILARMTVQFNRICVHFNQNLVYFYRIVCTKYPELVFKFTAIDVHSDRNVCTE